MHSLSGGTGTCELYWDKLTCLARLSLKRYSTSSATSVSKIFIDLLLGNFWSQFTLHLKMHQLTEAAAEAGFIFRQVHFFAQKHIFLHLSGRNVQPWFMWKYLFWCKKISFAWNLSSWILCEAFLFQPVAAQVQVTVGAVAYEFCFLESNLSADAKSPLWTGLCDTNLLY